MNEKWLAEYLTSPNTTKQQALIELKKYRSWVSERISSQAYRRIDSYLRKRKELQKRRIANGFKECLEFIHKKIEEGQL